MHARGLFDALPVPWRAIPGNHDIGDIDQVDESRRRDYDECFGEGSWMVAVDGWRLVGFDVQTLASSAPGSDLLWTWLEGVTGDPEPTAVFMHRPLMPLVAGEHDYPIRYVGEPALARLLRLFSDRDVRLVSSGHVHQWRTATADGVRYVWAPSTWATLPDRIQPVIGAKVTGIVEISSASRWRPRWCGPGHTSPTIGEDFASPYAH